MAIGTLYGKENGSLQTDILRALEGEHLIIYGTGNNYVPLLHIDTFLAGIKILEETHQDYSVLRDSQTYSQKDIKTTIANGNKKNYIVTGGIATCQPQELLYATE